MLSISVLLLTRADFIEQAVVTRADGVVPVEDQLLGVGAHSDVWCAAGGEAAFETGAARRDAAARSEVSATRIQTSLSCMAPRRLGTRQSHTGGGHERTAGSASGRPQDFESKYVVLRSDACR